MTTLELIEQYLAYADDEGRAWDYVWLGLGALLVLGAIPFSLDIKRHVEWAPRYVPWLTGAAMLVTGGLLLHTGVPKFIDDVSADRQAIGEIERRIEESAQHHYHVESAEPLYREMDGDRRESKKEQWFHSLLHGTIPEAQLEVVTTGGMTENFTVTWVDDRLHLEDIPLLLGEPFATVADIEKRNVAPQQFGH